MKRVLWAIALLGTLVFVHPAIPAGAASPATYTGGGWTLTLTFQKTAQGQVMSGSFRSGSKSYAVHGDWVPAADQGIDLLRFYGHPFGPKSSTGLVGLATLGNTCAPSCVASNHYKLAEVSIPLLSGKLPGINKPSLVLQLHT